MSICSLSGTAKKEKTTLSSNWKPTGLGWKTVFFFKVASGTRVNGAPLAQQKGQAATTAGAHRKTDKTGLVDSAQRATEQTLCVISPSYVARVGAIKIIAPIKKGAENITTSNATNQKIYIHVRSKTYWSLQEVSAIAANRLGVLIACLVT